MNISLGLMLITTLYYFLISDNEIKANVILFICFVLLLTVYSIFIGNDINNIMRFSILLIFILLAYLIKGKEIYIKIFLFLSTIQALIVVFLELFFLYNGSNDFPFFSRNILISLGWGDIYSPYGGIWKIQLKGNALLPFAFFVSVIYLQNKKRLIYSGLFIWASIFAGNFAFVLGIAFFIISYNFLFFKISKNKFFINMIIILSFTILVFEPISNYISHTIESKSINSNSHRILQTKVLVGNLAETTRSVLLGQGIGNIELKSSDGNFSNTTYFELQTLYILNQLGFIPFLVYLLINIYLSIHFIKYSKLLLIYFSYVFYAIWNPYIWDTNHIVVIIILLSLRKVLDEKNILNTRSI